MKLMRGRVLGEVNLQFLTYVMYICCQKTSHSCLSSQAPRPHRDPWV